MKPLTIMAALLGLTLAASAADPKPAPAPAPAPKTDTPKKAAEPKAEKVMPMHHKADEIDTTAMTFTYTTEKGTKVVNKITDKTIIMQGDKPAKFTDIKVGDVISGSHIKKSDTEYEVVKITKFAAAPEKKAPEPKTPEPAKKK